VKEFIFQVFKPPNSANLNILVMKKERIMFNMPINLLHITDSGVPHARVVIDFSFQGL